MSKPFQLNSLVLLIALLSTEVAMAESGDWEINGFFTQGYFLTDHNRFHGDSPDGSFDFRELAVNSSVRISDRLLLTGQVMSRRAGSIDDGTPALDYAMLDYRFIESEGGIIGMSVGRIKNPFGFYNKTRDVAFTRPSIILPQSLYFDKARNFELSSDGIMVYGRAWFDYGVIETELVVGMPPKDVNVEYAFLDQDAPGSFHDSEGYLWRTEFSSNDYSFIAGMTLGGFRLDFDGPATPALGDPGDGVIDIDLIVVSAQYNMDRWSFTSEFFQQDITWGSLGGGYALLPNVTTESLYGQVEYRLSNEVSLFLRRDLFFQNKDDRDGSQAQSLFGKPAFTQYSKDWTLGVGWQPSPSWLFRAEWHRVDGTAWLPPQDNPDLADQVKDWDILALQATYRF